MAVGSLTTGRARQLALGTAAFALLITPLWVYFAAVGSPLAYLRGEFPPGQAGYIMMRPAGHIAFVLLFFQVVVGAQGRPLARWLGIQSLVPLHRTLGIAALGFLLLHPLLFFWSRTLRAGHSAFRATFLPDPTENYWEKMLFVGAIGLYLLLLGIAAAIWGPRISRRWWRRVHSVNYAAFCLVFWHSIAIGAETRIAPLPYLWFAMAGTAGLLWARRIGRPLTS